MATGSSYRLPRSKEEYWGNEKSNLLLVAHRSMATDGRSMEPKVLKNNLKNKKKRREPGRRRT